MHQPVERTFLSSRIRILQVTEEKKYAKDPIPAKAILLADAFDWAFEKIYASPEILTTLGEFQEILKLNREREEGMGQYEEGSDLDRAATFFFAIICMSVICWRTFAILKQEIFFNWISSTGAWATMGSGRYVCPGVWIASLLTMTRFPTPILFSVALIGLCFCGGMNLNVGSRRPWGTKSMVEGGPPDRVRGKWQMNPWWTRWIA